MYALIVFFWLQFALLPLDATGPYKDQHFSPANTQTMG